MKGYEIFCDIYVRSERTSPRWQFLRKLSEDLKIPATEGLYHSLYAKDYSLKIRDHTFGGSPRYYHYNNFRSDYFNYWITYSPIVPDDCNLTEEELDKIHAKHITQILELLWTQGIPAATFSTIDELLLWEGGNDQSKIFWKDEPKYKKSEGTC